MTGQRMYPSIMIKKLENPANFSGDENAINLGVISPKMRSKKVMRIISKIITTIAEVFGKRFHQLQLRPEQLLMRQQHLQSYFPKE